MSKLNLTLSERFATEDPDALCAALSAHLSLGKTRFLVRMSADPPSVIQLVGNAAAWLPLAAPAAVYFSTLAKRAGDASWDAIASRLKSTEARPLADVATTLTETSIKSAGKVEIIFGLNIPDDHFCTGVRIKDANPAAVAYNLAAFVLHVEDLEGVMLAEIEAGNAPFGQVTVDVQDAGSLLVKWRSQPGLKEHERRFSKDAQQRAR